MTKLGALAFSLFLAVVILAGGSSKAFAAAQSKGVSLTTSPVSTELTTKPGTSTSTNIQVMNNTATPLKITLSVQSFKPYGTDGKAQIQPFDPHDPSLQWVSFSENNFVAQPNVWVTVKMTINVPSSAAFGYYYAVLVKPNIISANKAHTNTLKSSNAILVLLNAQTANEHPSIQLSSFTSLHQIYEYLPATFNINVHNNGNIFLAPFGNIFISKNSSFNKIIDTLQINEDEGNVLPNSNRIFSSQWTDGFPVFTPKLLNGQPIQDNSGNVIYQLKWNFSNNGKFRFGKYYAKMVLVYSNGTRDIPITAVVSFWVIPWKLILLGLLVVLIVVGLIFTAFYYKHKSKKSTKWRA